jgi:hypothetical protein
MAMATTAERKIPLVPIGDLKESSLRLSVHDMGTRDE